MLPQTIGGCDILRLQSRPHVAQICDLDAEMCHVGIGEIPNRFNECPRIVFGTRTDEAKRVLPKHRPVRASSCCSAFLDF